MQKNSFRCRSPLVKTAVAGGDPNWERIIMGIGKSGEKVNTNKLTVKIGNYLVAEKGRVASLTMKKNSKNIELGLNTLI